MAPPGVAAAVAAVLEEPAAAVAAALVAMTEQAVAVAEAGALFREQAANPATLLAEVIAKAILGVMAPGDRGSEIGLARAQVASQDLLGHRVVESVGGGRPAGRHRGDQGNRERHPSPMTEAHRHSLVV